MSHSRQQDAIAVAQEALRVQSTALQSSTNLIYVTDASGSIEWVNRAFSTVTGYDSREALGQNPRLLKSGVQSEAF